MRRVTAILSTALLAGLLLGPTVVGVSAATVSAAGFTCDPNGTTGGSPTTKLSGAVIDTTTPANSRLTCLFRGTRLPASFGGTCHFGNGTFLVEFSRRTLLPVNNNTTLLCTGATTVSGSTDLAITKTDGVTTVVPNTDTTYTIGVSNAGPNPVSGASVTDTFPAAITSATWTAAGAGGASGFTASGSGNIADTVTLPVGGTITYTVTAHIDAAATGSIANTATVAMPAGLTDPVPGNNSATDTNTVPAPTISLSFSATFDPNFCNVIVQLSNYAANTTYAGDYLGWVTSNPSINQHFPFSISTDGTGGANFIPFSILQGDRSGMATVNGVSSSAMVVSC